MVQAVLKGSEYISKEPAAHIKTLEEREKLIIEKAGFYKKAAATSGAGTGAGGLRDYIDLAKMMQLVPVIGAFVGAYANYQLMDKLVETTMNGYRLRKLDFRTFR